MYYFNADGYMVSNAWVGNYYVGNDGAMLTNTTTPDGYYVGADGIRVADMVFYPIAGYADILANAGKNAVRGYPTDIIDHGNYYEMVNQTIEKLKEYDTKAEAKKDMKKGSGWLHIQTLPNGKYYLTGYGDSYNTEVVYSGSIYISKDATCEYYGGWQEGSIINLPFSDFMARIQEINKAQYFGDNSEIYATIESVDEKGYVTHLKKLHPDAMP